MKTLNIFRNCAVIASLFASSSVSASTEDFVDLVFENNTSETITVAEISSKLVTGFPTPTTLAPKEKSKATRVTFEDSFWENGSVTLAVTVNGTTTDCNLNFVPPGMQGQPFPQLLIFTLSCPIHSPNGTFTLTSTNKEVSSNQAISTLIFQ